MGVKIEVAIRGMSPSGNVAPRALRPDVHAWPGGVFESHVWVQQEEEQLWEQMEAGSHMYARHPVRRREDHTSMCIPLGMHGDGVTCTGDGRAWSKGADAFCMVECFLNSGNTIFKCPHLRHILPAPHAHPLAKTR